MTATCKDCPEEETLVPLRAVATPNSLKERNRIPPTKGTAVSRRRRSAVGNHRRDPKTQQEGFSLQIMLRRGCPSWQHYVTTGSNSSPNQAKLQFQVPTQGRNRRYRPLRKENKQQPVCPLPRRSEVTQNNTDNDNAKGIIRELQPPKIM